MTSQKSLKNNVNSNDFKRSLLGSILFPAVAFIVLFVFLTIPIIQYVTDKDFLMQQVHNEVSMFLAPDSTFSYMFELLPIGMIACGMLTAAKSFNYLLSKKQVNVFLSLGIKRNTMFVNRLFSGIIALFVAVSVPMFIIYITNIVNFGITAHLTKLFLYVTSLLFVAGLTGFSVASAMIMVSGNLFEVALSSISLTLIPLFTYVAGNSAMFSFLKGYIRTSDSDVLATVLNPWEMACNLHNEYRNAYVDEIYDYSEPVVPATLLRLLERDTTPEKFKVPEYLNVDWGFILPIVIWLVVSVVLIGVTFYLFNRRKAEHANSLGKFPISRAVICTFGFVALSTIVIEYISYEINSMIIIFLLVVLATALAYFLVQLILTRKFKPAVKSFKWYAVLLSILTIYMVVIGTGIFGTYNKIPDKADVKSVSIEATEVETYGHYIYPWQPNEDFVECSTDNGKEAVLKTYELLKNEKTKFNEDPITSITLAIRDNDGDVKYRDFDIYSEETYVKYLELVYGSDFFDTLLKNYMLEDIPANPQDDSTGHLKKYAWAYSDSDMLVNLEDGIDYIEDIDGLLEALYKDLSVMTWEQLFKNPERPVGVLVRSYPDADYPGITPAYVDTVYEPADENGYIVYSDVVYYDEEYVEPEYEHTLLTDTIPIYAGMTNTLNFLKENGYNISEEKMKIKEVLYTDGTLSLRNAQAKFAKANKDDYKGWGDYDTYFPEFTPLSFDQTAIYLYSHDMIGYFLTKSTNEYDLLKRIYKDAGHPLISVTDTAKAEEIADKTVSSYLTLNDEGRFVYIVYEEGPIVCYYLPEANVSVVK